MGVGGFLGNSLAQPIPRFIECRLHVAKSSARGRG